MVYKIRDFRPISGYMWGMKQDRATVTINGNRKSYALYQNVTLPMILSDL